MLARLCHSIHTDQILFDDVPVNYDYSLAIRECLNKINDEFRSDPTSAEARQQQRVSFNEHVRAKDIVNDPSQYEHTDLLVSSATMRTYDLPLNDIQTKQNETSMEYVTDGSIFATSMSTELLTKKETSHVDSKRLSANSMIVAVNGRFDLQHTSDYTANNKKRMHLASTPSRDVRHNSQASIKRSFAIRPKSSDSRSTMVPTNEHQ
jgi:hypothetical protein